MVLLVVAGIGAWSLGGWVSGLLCVCGGGGVSLRCHLNGGDGVYHLRLISAVKKEFYEDFSIPLALNT